MSRHRFQRCRPMVAGSFVALLLLSLLGCAEDTPLIEVRVTGLTPDIKVLSVTPSIAGKVFPPQSNSTRLDSFFVKLPRSAMGQQVGLSILGTTTEGCEMAQADGGIEIPGPGRYLMELTLLRSDPPGCGVSIVKSGGRARFAQVTSDVLPRGRVR